MGMEALRSENEELKANLAESRKYAQEVRFNCALVCACFLREGLALKTWGRKS